MAHTEEHAHKRQFSLKVDERGRMVLPAELRKEMGVEPNDRLVAIVDDDGSLRVISAREAVRRARGLLRRMAPSPSEGSLVDDLIAERRREAARE